MIINYTIGASYRYPETNVNSNNKFILTDYFENRGVFLFKCGHWCTDSVFVDLINTKTGIQVYKDTQIKLF